jgi:serine/threonine protein kinase
MAIDLARAKSVFLAASDIADPQERAAFLNRECDGRTDLRERVEALLRANDAAPLPAPEPSEDTAAFASAEPNPAVLDPATDKHTVDLPGKDQHAGTVIAGRFKLLEPIGEGGMGSVWRAQQSEPVKRFVAVKLIKAGMDSRQVLARFEAERQALAMMDHPNIAKVLDGGLHEHRPYFVMELVKGVPITDYCDHYKLTPKERLELFVPVCQAIQHAHQKGIIHRDIKPSNVLVALYDDKPVVKVIDFGVAKATAGALTEQTLDTGFGGVVGTPSYMSPEQATFNNLDIDTRSDVYALGVLLYELLTGSPPFARKDLEKKGLLEMLRVVREEEPPRPSTKLSTADALPTLSANRGTEPKKLTVLLRNELDWIVMKSLEKDRTRRYESANGLAADVGRYLSGEAVLAHPPSTSYRVKKFVHRHQGKVIAVSLVLFALLTGMAGTTWGLIEAKKQERLALAAQQAEANLAESERVAKIEALSNEKLASERLLQVEAEKKKADEEKSIAQAVRDFLQKKLLGQADALTQANSLLHSGRSSTYVKENPTIRELLDRAAQELAPEKIEANFPKQPLLQAEILNTVGDAYRGIGDPIRAIEYLERSAKLREQYLGADDPVTLTTLQNLGRANESDSRVITARKLYERVSDARAKKLGADAPATLETLESLAMIYRNGAQPEKAIQMLVHVRDVRLATLGADHKDTLITIYKLAMAYQMGRDAEAIPLFERARDGLAKILGADHPDTLIVQRGLAGSYRKVGRVQDAIALFERTYNAQVDRLGAGHPDTAYTLISLADAYWIVDRPDKTIAMYEEVVKRMEARLGRQHNDTQYALMKLGYRYRTAGRLTEAIPLLEEVYKGSRGLLYRVAGYELFDVYTKTGKSTEAIKLLPELLAADRRNLPPSNPQLANKLAQYAQGLLQIQLYSEAEPLLRECLSILEKKEPDDWRTFNTQSMLGGALLGLNKYADAEPLLLKGYDGMKAREKTIPLLDAARIPEALDRLIELYTATKNPDEVKKWQVERAKYPTPKEVTPMPRVVK